MCVIQKRIGGNKPQAQAAVRANSRAVGAAAGTVEGGAWPVRRCVGCAGDKEANVRAPGVNVTREKEV
jgi:hypothetical protein